MVDNNTTQKKLDDLASKLNQTHSDTAERLRELSRALGGNDPSILYWADTNIHQVFDVETIVHEEMKNFHPGWVRWVELLRNVLILLPLVLTWGAISQASAKYAELIANNRSMETRPFLELWQGGFDGLLSGFFILSNVATFDCGILLLLLVLTFFVSWKHSVQNAGKEQFARNRAAEIAQILGDATLGVAFAKQVYQQKQPQNMQGIVSQLTSIASDFKRTTNDFMHELADERQKRGSLKDFSDALGWIAQDMRNAAQKTSDANAGLVSTIKEIAMPIKGIPLIATSAKQAIDELNAMTGSLRTLVSDQNRWRQELQTILSGKLDNIYQEQKTSTQSLHTMMQDALDKQLADQQASDQSLFTMLDDSLKQLLTEMKKNGANVIDSTDMLEESIKNFDGTIKSLNNSIKKQENLLILLDEQQKSQLATAEHMNQASTEINRLLRAVPDAVPTMHALNIDINKLRGKISELPDILQKELLAPLKYYSNAAAKIDTGSQSLEQAAFALHNVAHRLNGNGNQNGNNSYPANHPQPGPSIGGGHIPNSPPSDNRQ